MVTLAVHGTLPILLSLVLIAASTAKAHAATATLTLNPTQGYLQFDPVGQGGVSGPPAFSATYRISGCLPNAGAALFMPPAAVVPLSAIDTPIPCVQSGPGAPYVEAVLTGWAMATPGGGPVTVTAALLLPDMRCYACRIGGSEATATYTVLVPKPPAAPPGPVRAPAPPATQTTAPAPAPQSSTPEPPATPAPTDEPNPTPTPTPTPSAAPVPSAEASPCPLSHCSTRSIGNLSRGPDVRLELAAALGILFVGGVAALVVRRRLRSGRVP